MHAPAQSLVLTEPEAAAASITATITTIAVASERASAAAEGVADLIACTAKSDALAAADKAQVVAAAIIADVTDHAVNAAEEGWNEFAALRRRVCEEVARHDIPDAQPNFYFVRDETCHDIKTAGRLPRDQVAVTIAGAVAAVANAVANAPAGTRLAIAAAYQTTSKHATDVVRKAVRGTSQGDMLLEQLERYGESLRHTGGASSPRPCCAAAALGHETDLRTWAALGALRAYTANMGHVQAARALDAVVAGPRLSSAGSHSWRRARWTCACTGEGGGKGEGEGNVPAGCEAVLRADKQLTALCAVWSLHETTAPESEAAKALAAAVAGAVGGTSAPPLERSSAGEIRGCRDTLLQLVREMDEELSRAEAATAGSD